MEKNIEKDLQQDAIVSEPSPELQSAREKMIKKALAEGQKLTSSQQDFYDEKMAEQDENVIDFEPEHSETETAVDFSETKKGIIKPEKDDQDKERVVAQQELDEAFAKEKTVEQKLDQKPVPEVKEPLESTFETPNLFGQIEKKAEKDFERRVAQKEILDRESFVEQKLATVVQKSWQELYQQAYDKMPDKQKQEFVDLVSGKQEHKLLSPNEVANLVIVGFSFEDIKNVKRNWFLSSKIKSKLSSEPVGEDEFTALIEKTIKSKKDELESKAKTELSLIWEEKRKKVIEELTNRMLEKEKIETEKRVKATEEELKVSEKNPESVLEKLNHLRAVWKSVEKLDKAIKSGGKFIFEGEKLDMENDADKQKLELMRGHFSDDVINTADNLSERNLRKEFWNKKFGEGKISSTIPTEKERGLFRQEFREWITGQVKEIFKNSAKELEATTGKKLRAEKIEKPLNNSSVIKQISQDARQRLVEKFGEEKVKEIENTRDSEKSLKIDKTTSEKSNWEKFYKEVKKTGEGLEKRPFKEEQQKSVISEVEEPEKVANKLKKGKKLKPLAKRKSKEISKNSL